MDPKNEEMKQAERDTQHHVDPFIDERPHGNLVALEGDEDVIDIQLRLLPPSSKILIFSALKDAIPVPSGKFSARTFVRDVHAAFTARSESARAFLQSSTSSQPRLVFMNGGCVGARTACVTQIAENITKGNVRAAEEVLDRVIKDGVAGLFSDDEVDEVDELNGKDEKVDEVTEIADQDPQPLLDDPSSVAMRAAENLDRETAELQPEAEQKIGCSAIPPVVVHKDDTRNPEVTHHAFTDNSAEVFQEPIIIVPSRSTSLNDKRSTFGHHSSYTANTAYTEIFSQDEKELDSETDAGDEGDACHRESLRPTTPMPAVEFGRAFIIDVQSARPTQFGRKRSASLDQLLDNMTHSDSTPYAALKRTPSDTHINISDRPSTSDGLPRLRTAFLKASETTIRKLPTRSPHFTESCNSSDRRLYVDQGTDPIEVEEPVVKAPFEPVFPVIEDLIINFMHGNRNPVIDLTIQSYKNGTYVPLPPSEPQTAPPSPHDSHFTLDEFVSKYGDEDDQSHYDLETPTKDLPQRRGSKIKNPGTTTAAPLTPASTPPPQKFGVAHKFLPFVSNAKLTPIGVQNSFRALLTAHFPPSSTGFKQYAYASDLDRLWKPVFRSEGANGKESRTVDQIIAVGCEDGVRKDFLGEIVGGIEALGRKKNGISRSGRLDIGYLVANAMQIYTTPHPSILPTSPLSNSAYLASLLVPHLESYLAANSTTRLLILQYPASYLPTILALRNLLGNEILKIVGITDAQRNAPSSPRVKDMLSNEGAAALRSRLSPSPPAAKPIDPSFAKANFSLTSLSSSIDIAHFYTQIQRSLLEKSSFYMTELESSSPDSVPRPSIPAKSASRDTRRALKDTASLSSSDSHSNLASTSTSPYTFSKASKGGKASGVLGIGVGSGAMCGMSGVGDRSTPRTARAKSRTRSPSRSGRAASRAPSMSASARREKAWEEFELSDEEEFDRVFVAPGRRKGSSRKALKWLGLLT